MLLEAIYMKKLCVISDAIGNHDVIHSEDNGFNCSEVDEFINVIRISLVIISATSMKSSGFFWWQMHPNVNTVKE